MLADYRDIRSKLGTPAWFDEHGVPRYCEFRPTNLANIYATEAVLFLVGCQVCGKGFLVAMSRCVSCYKRPDREQRPRLWRSAKRGLRNASMSSVPQSVLQYWSRPQMGDWRQDHRLEVRIRLPWMDEDDDGLVQRSTSAANSECAPPYDLTDP